MENSNSSSDEFQNNEQNGVPRQPVIFNEKWLQEEIKKTWSEHGAHMDLYNKILKSKFEFSNYNQYIDFEIQSASLFKWLLMGLFPRIFKFYYVRKHNRYLKVRYPEE